MEISNRNEGTDQGRFIERERVKKEKPQWKEGGVPNGIRTRVAGLKGRRPRPG